MIANHPFAKRGALNPLDDNGQPGCAVCGRPPGAHPVTVFKQRERLFRERPAPTETALEGDDRP